MQSTAGGTSPAPAIATLFFTLISMSWTPAEKRLTPQWRSWQDGGWGGGRPGNCHQRLPHLEVRQLAVPIVLLDIHWWGRFASYCSDIVYEVVVNDDIVGGWGEVVHQAKVTSTVDFEITRRLPMLRRQG